jgi:hypothetical protein
MSFKSKVLAGAAPLALVGGVAVVGGLSASAANPSCGHRCVNLFSKKFSDVLTTKPPFVIDVYRQGANVGQPIIMFQASNADPAEDFTRSLEGHVSDFVTAGLISPVVALHYGQPATPGNPNARNDLAVEYQYSPSGVNSGLCIGVAATAINNEGVTLQPCGVSAKTVWIVDRQNTAPGGIFTFPYRPLTNGSDTNFSQAVRAHLPAEWQPERQAAPAAGHPEPAHVLAWPGLRQPAVVPLLRRPAVGHALVSPE